MSFSNSWWIDWSNWFIDWIYLFRWWMPRNFFWCQRSESIVFCVRFVVNSMMWPFVVLIPHSPIRLLDVFCWITTHRSIIMNWAIYPTFWKRGHCFPFIQSPVILLPADGCSLLCEVSIRVHLSFYHLLYFTAVKAFASMLTRDTDLTKNEKL